MKMRALNSVVISVVGVLQGVAIVKSSPQHTDQSMPTVTRMALPAGATAPGIDWIRVAAPDGGVMLAAITHPTGSGRFPAMLILHGTHGFAQQYVDLAQEFARQGVVGIAACWFAGSRGAGTRFVTPIDCPGGPPLIEASSDAAQERIGALVVAIRKLSFVDPNRIGIFGHSRGGGAALNRILKVSDVAAVVLDSAGYPDAAVAQASRITVPILILHGTKECPDDGGTEMTTAQRARVFENAVRRERHTVEAKYYDACHNGIFESHSQFIDSVQRAAEFLRRGLCSRLSQ